MTSCKYYQVIVVGGGHAGIEAACAAARLEVSTLLLLDNFDRLGAMSCNPSIGGIGKSHLVKEVDALDGVMAKAADAACVQCRVLNASKGAAVQATRMQIDRKRYSGFMQQQLLNYAHLTVQQQHVTSLVLDSTPKVCGVKTACGETIYSGTVVLAAGTFLNGSIFIGLNRYPAGRLGDAPSVSLAQNLKAMGLPVKRLKTGTPPRLAANSIDFTKLVPQPSDDAARTRRLSIWPSNTPRLAELSCYITRTNERTHEIIRNNLNASPLFTGMISGVGPRYCPSIEDKICRFKERDSHQVFLEPEGHHSTEIYPNGISTSLPLAVQEAMVHSMLGLENARILRPGYAIEYDYFDPQQLNSDLSSKAALGLFIAGQLNGTTGYEEAAAQGVLAGINAARTVLGKDTWIPRRDQAYLGVMVDDLITKGVTEPYRMFTSRAEYRLQLREDNAAERLSAIGFELGVVTKEHYEFFTQQQARLQSYQKMLQEMRVDGESDLGAKLKALWPNYRAESSWELLKRPEFLNEWLEDVVPLDALEKLRITSQYEGYLARQEQQIAAMARDDALTLPKSINYAKIAGLSNEIKQRLTQLQPASLGQASRIYGVTPAAVAILRLYLIKNGLSRR